MMADMFSPNTTDAAPVASCSWENVLTAWFAAPARAPAPTRAVSPPRARENRCFSPSPIRDPASSPAARAAEDTCAPADFTLPDSPDHDDATPPCARRVARSMALAPRPTSSPAPRIVDAARRVPDAARVAEDSTCRFAAATDAAMRCAGPDTSSCSSAVNVTRSAMAASVSHRFTLDRTSSASRSFC